MSRQIRPTAAVTQLRTRVLASADAQPPWMRTVAGGLLAALLALLIVLAVAPMAHADDPSNKDQKDYSLYHLASNASVYFSEKSAPENGGKGVGNSWKTVVANPAQAGSMLGYADDDGFVKWLFSTISGSSQTIKYDALDSAQASGMKDYAHFGAAAHDLGFDAMMSSAGFDPMIHAVGGSLIWLVYALAMGVSLLFWIFIQILKLLNPFLWFHDGIAAVSPAYKTWADGMVTTSSGVNTTPDALSGLSSFVSQWYGALVSLSWGVLVPLFIGFLLLGLVFFKKMERGSAIKKVAVRIVFIGVGLPLIGGMYTSILNQFDDSLLSQSSGPTKVVLSTYVDFDAWMNTNRLQVPANASITWDASTGHAQPVSVFSARNSALAINAQTGQFPGISAGEKISDAGSAWANSTPRLKDNDTDKNTVFATLGMLSRYLQGQTVNASDFESNIQGSVTAIDPKDVDWDLKKDWFLGKSYKDSQDFGDGNKPVPPNEHPLLATSGSGLTAKTDGASTEFTSTSGNTRCGFRVVEPNTDGKPADCNLSPLSAYNYLNTEFNTDSMTIFSSNKVTSGFTRSFHSSVAQIGSGPASFMYWANTFTLLSSITLIGIFYGVGMLTGALRRTFGTVAAVPFATLGVMAGIAKVVIYSIAMILEVLVTLFLYQFVSELLVSLPQIIEGPIAKLVSSNPTGSGRGFANIFSNPVLGSIAVVVMTVVSIILIVGVTFTLLRVRKTVLKALDEAVTKLVDKFLDTTTPPKQTNGGLMPAIANGLGAGAGMAAASGMMGKLGGKPPKTGPHKPTNTGQPGTATTNAGGTNGGLSLAGKQRGELTGGRPGELEGRSPGPMLPPGDGGPAGNPAGPRGPGGRGGPVSGRELPVGADVAGAGGTGIAGGADTRNGTDGAGNGRTGHSHSSVADTGSPIATSDNKPGTRPNRSQKDRDLAETVTHQGGLTDLGVGPQNRNHRRSPGQTGPSTGQKISRPNGGSNDSSAVNAHGRPNGAGRPPSMPPHGSGPSNSKATTMPSKGESPRIPRPTRSPRIERSASTSPQQTRKPDPTPRTREAAPAPQPPQQDKPTRPARPALETPRRRDRRQDSSNE
ncbi:hypothetical protein JOF29_000135 [Kribbella aluminosa]|uniref:TrbL/VirB6 plasmid conjugal transfer protein n=1 Tax=Kribbella aluminosa TaxID=416017 RepID=A0ABS4UBN6_9ACTN|nr:hypothetical protein [Kribbella aluminosa]MBP2349052.1 hypothetical protein [Kribbella aluminosa]